MAEVYNCDPEKHKDCSKTGCYINGGPCRFTSHAEYRKDDLEVKAKPSTIRKKPRKKKSDDTR